MSFIREKYKPFVRPINPNNSLAVWVEKTSIQAHLAYCELRLRLTTRHNQLRRRKLLNILHHYWRAGRFPKNIYRFGRQPVFIDNSDIYCAVGYLMSQTGEDGLARKINQQDKFIFLEETNRQDVAAWLKKNELKPARGSSYSTGLQSDRPSLLSYGLRFWEVVNLSRFDFNDFISFYPYGYCVVVNAKA